MDCPFYLKNAPSEENIQNVQVPIAKINSHLFLYKKTLRSCNFSTKYFFF